MANFAELDDDMRARIQSLAESKQRSAHWVVREAINEYVDREEKRRSFDQATIESLQEFEETGLHLTGDEVFAWMETWGTDEESVPPPCHT